MTRGHAAAFGAFLCWGFWPIYWKFLDHVPALEITAHRLAWCCVWVVALLCITRGRAWLRPLLAQPRLLGQLTLSSLFIGSNWFLYIWAVNNDHIVETALGYFINPLINVLFGVLIFRERLNRAQWLAVTVAAIGVAYMTLAHGRLPWIALLLAMSFGLYSVIRKVAAVESITGLAWESTVFFPLAAGWLLWLGLSGQGAFTQVDVGTDVLLIVSGAGTALPLIWYAYAARRVPLSTLGIVQYMAPTLQLLCGVVLFKEPFTRIEAIGFACIWTALLVYTLDGAFRRWRLAPKPV